MQSRDGGASHGRSQLGNKIAHLISVRHQHQLGLLRFDELFERSRESVWGVGLELGRLDRIDLRDLLGGNFVGKIPHAAADDCSFERPTGLSRKSLTRGERLPGDAVQFAFALFDDD